MPSASSRVASGKWQVTSGKWQVTSGKWQMAMPFFRCARTSFRAHDIRPVPFTRTNFSFSKYFPPLFFFSSAKKVFSFSKYFHPFPSPFFCPISITNSRTFLAQFDNNDNDNNNDENDNNNNNDSENNYDNDNRSDNNDHYKECCSDVERRHQSRRLLLS